MKITLPAAAVSGVSEQTNKQTRLETRQSVAVRAGQGSVTRATGSRPVCLFGGRGGALVVYYYNLSEWL